MSNTDSFIDEVSEEVRRDKLFRLARRYGWIVALVIVLIVAGAAALEWRKASQRGNAQALGDAMLGALEHENSASRAAALEDVAAEGDAQAIVLLVAAAELAGSDAEAAGALLEQVEALPDIQPAYRDLAVLKLTMIPDYPLFSDEKIARLEPLAIPGRPFRLTAMEQMAYVHIERGESDEALTLLSQIASDAEASPAQRQRAAQLTIALGGDASAL